LAVDTDQEAALVSRLRKRHGHVSIERVLSGQGLENLHSVLLESEGRAADKRAAREISEAALANSDRQARRALDLFCCLLGSVAGDMALMFGASGGVYLGGGIVPAIVDYLARSDFRRRFESKGRLSAYVSRIATKVIVRPDPAFVGLVALAQSP
jgi:glucokinase